VRPVNAAAPFTRVLGRHGYADKWDDPVWKIGFYDRSMVSRAHRYPAIIPHGESRRNDVVTESYEERSARAGAENTCGRDGIARVSLRVSR